MDVLYLDASKCTNCGSENIGFNEKKAEFFCRKCGFILMDNIPVIESKYGKVEKVFVSRSKKKIAVMIKGILKTPMERKMTPFYEEIKKFNLPKYIEAEVLTLAKKAVELKLTMSFSKIEILSALIYYVSKREEIPVMIKDLEKIYRIGKKKIMKTLKFLKKELELDKKTVISVESYIIRIASDIGHNGRLATEAIKVSKKMKIGHPLLKAAVAIWIAGKRLKIKIKKKDLSKFAGISGAALRKNIKESI